MADQDEYKFPDEQTQATSDNDIEVEVIDDTPEVDRGRAPMPKDIVDDLEKDDLEEYSDKVKKRLGQMKKVWHDERREKERESREKTEAVRYAQQVYEENKLLKQQLGQGRKALVHEATRAATNELATAKEHLRQAYETGNSEQITDAQEVLTDVKLKLREYERFKPSLQNEDSDVQPQRLAAAAPQVVDRKAEAWREKNTWFGAKKGMTAFALGLHEELVESGMDPRSDEYYGRVDTTMRNTFPDYFGGKATQTTERDERPASRTKTVNVVAPVTRSTAPRQVRLTPTQVSLAKKLGVTPEAYAKELIKQENYNG